MPKFINNLGVTQNFTECKSNIKEHLMDALALKGDEGRGRLR